MTTNSEHRAAVRINLRRLLSPRHVAFIGGHTNVPAIEMLRAAGFKGDIWPVHPSRDRLAGHAVFPSVADLPEPPDAAFLNVPGRVTNDILRSLDARGAGGAVCFAAGYAELGEAGRHAQKQLAAAAGDLAVIGPNSTGFLNYFDNVALWPVHDHTPRKLDRGVAIASASGGVLFNYSVNQRSLYPAVMIGVGNQAVVDIADYVDVLADDGRVSAIGLFMEDVGDPVAFSHAAGKALERDIPIVALKTGASARGAAVAQTHSGALVAPDDVIDALFERAGVIRVRSLPALDETLKMLTIPKRPAGRRMALLTNSGGEKALAADAAEGTAIEFPMPSAPVTKLLAEQIPDFATVSNPFDFNAYFAGEDIFSMENEPALQRCFETMIGDGYDIAMLLHGSRTREDGTVDTRENVMHPTRDAFIKACKAQGVCGVVTACLPEHMPYREREHLIGHGIAPLMGMNEAMAAVDGAIRYAQRAASHAWADLGLPPDPKPKGQGRLLNEAEGKAALAALGLCVPANGRAETPEDAARVAARIGFPVVLKALDPVLAHKMKAGGVALNLRSGDEVRAAMTAMATRLSAGGMNLREVLVERMIDDARGEFIIGAKYEPRFGHVLVLGRGGVDVEELGRADTLLLPATGPDLARFIDNARALARAAPEIRAAMRDATGAVAAYVAANRARTIALDVNPLIAGAAGTVTAVDVLIQTTG